MVRSGIGDIFHMTGWDYRVGLASACPLVLNSLQLQESRITVRRDRLPALPTKGNRAMAWTTPILVEICIGLEINGYLPAEF